MLKCGWIWVLHGLEAVVGFLLKTLLKYVMKLTDALVLRINEKFAFYKKNVFVMYTFMSYLLTFV